MPPGILWTVWVTVGGQRRDAYTVGERRNDMSCLYADVVLGALCLLWRWWAVETLDEPGHGQRRRQTRDCTDRRTNSWSCALALFADGFPMTVFLTVLSVRRLIIVRFARTPRTSMGRDRSRPVVRLSLPMEQPTQYPAMHQRHQLFQSAQLPPPSQLHLPIPSSSYSRSNTLPPITHIPPAQQTHSFPSINTYHPGPAVLPSLPPSPTSQHPWQTQHRTSNSREEFYPQQPNLTRSEHARPPPIVKDEPNGAHRPYPLHDPQPSSQHHPLPVKESASVEDGMPSTSDFVKKLYKWALTFPPGVTSCDNRRLPL